MLSQANPRGVMDPDMNFTFSQLNQAKIKDLLVNGLNKDEYADSEVSSLKIFDVFTNIIIEALQHLEFIPSQLEQDMEEM